MPRWHNRFWPTRFWHCVPFAIVAIPVVAEVVRKAVAGWTPTSDDGAFAVNAHDVFSMHPTWLGASSSVGAMNPSGFPVFHLGPMEWWALAIPERFGTQRMGVAVGAALVVLVSVFGIVRIARRLGGQNVALWTAAVVAMTMWSVGNETLADPWSPFIGLWPFAFCLVGAIEIASGRLRSLPWFAFAASFAVQCHYLFLIPIAAVTVVSLVWLALVWLGLHRLGAPQSERDQLRRSVFATVAVLTCVWLPAVIQQVRGKPGNLAEWWRATQSLSNKHIRIAEAANYVVHTIGAVPLFARGPLSTSQLNVLGQPTSVFAKVTAAIIVLILLAFGLVGMRRRADRGAVPIIALAALAGAAFTVTRYPPSFPALPHYRIVLLWPVGALVWCAGAQVLSAELSTRKPSAFADVSRRAGTFVGLVTAISMAVAASVSASPSGPSSALEQRATLRLTDQILERLNRHRHYVIAGRGIGATFVQLGVLRELLRTDISIGVSRDEGQLKSRYFVRDLRNVDRLVIASGTLAAPAHAILVATFDGRDPKDDARTEQRRQDLIAALPTHAPKLRLGLHIAANDELLHAIAQTRLTPGQCLDPRIFGLILSGDLKADPDFIGAVGRYSQIVTAAHDREFAAYIEPAVSQP